MRRKAATAVGFRSLFSFLRWILIYISRFIRLSRTSVNNILKIGARANESTDKNAFYNRFACAKRIRLIEICAGHLIKVR